MPESRRDTGQRRPLPDISAMQDTGRSPLHLLLDDWASRDGARGFDRRRRARDLARQPRTLRRQEDQGRLERKGVTASKRRIGGIMRERGMRARTRADGSDCARRGPTRPGPRTCRTRGSDGYVPHARPAGDLTSVRVGGGWAYVCLLAGLADRGIAGHSAGRPRDAGLVLAVFAALDFPLTDVQETGVCRPEGSAGPSSRILTLGDNSMQADRVRETERINDAFLEEVVPFAVHGATIVDARGMTKNGWLVSDGRSIVETGCAETDFETACRLVHVEQDHIVNANGMVMAPGYVDIHSHGAWGSSFDDGEKGITTARAGHMAHGTTRQVLSLITNPIDVICGNLKTVHDMMPDRPDILGAHLEGPFLAMPRKGAHDPNCLVDPTPDLVSRMLDAADGCLRQITIAPELPHGIDAIRRFFLAGVVPAVGHCDADYQTARKGFDAGAGIMTHMFNAMNGLHHRDPGPIPAAVEDPRVTIELINDGFHVQDPMVKLGFGLAPHRIAFVTDAMAATDCPDGHYLLGALDVDVRDGHARLASNGAIAGSTLLLEKAVSRAVLELGISPVDAVEAATLTPARAFGFDRRNDVTGFPIGLLAPGFAADVLLLDQETWTVRRVWCNGHPVR